MLLSLTSVTGSVLSVAEPQEASADSHPSLEIVAADTPARFLQPVSSDDLGHSVSRV